MRKNVGSTDKIIRFIIALGLFSLFFFLEGDAKYFGLLGIVPLATGMLNYCPLFTVLGISTVEKKKAE